MSVVYVNTAAVGRGVVRNGRIGILIYGGNQRFVYVNTAAVARSRVSQNFTFFFGDGERPFFVVIVNPAAVNRSGVIGNRHRSGLVAVRRSLDF